jgi:hypothetical protein
MEGQDRRERIVQALKDQAQKLGQTRDIKLDGVNMVENEKGTTWTMFLGRLSIIEMWESKLGLGPISKKV